MQRTTEIELLNLHRSYVEDDERKVGTPVYAPEYYRGSGKRMAADGDVKHLIGALRSLEDAIQHKGLSRRTTNSLLGKVTKAARTDRVKVYVRVVFLKLGEIDTIHEKFAADAFIEARWREPALDGQTEHVDTMEECDWAEYWSPKLFVENSLGDSKEEVWHMLRFTDAGLAMVYEKRRIKGSFQEILELEDFPFDTQDLSLTITTERSELEMELIEDPNDPSVVNSQSFVDEQEWHLHKHVESHTRVTTSAYKNSKHKHPAITLSCRATRRAKYFFWNIIVVMMFICSLSFATFAVNPTLPQNRLQLTFILLLSNITFKFVVSQTLPKVSYLTYLDKYILSSMFILCIVCVWHAIVAVINRNISEEMAKTMDTYAVIVLGTIYLLLLLTFFVWNRILIYKQMKRDFKKDVDESDKDKNGTITVELEMESGKRKRKRNGKEGRSGHYELGTDGCTS